MLSVALVGRLNGKSMRDIRGDLQDRANVVEQQISAENPQFEQLILQLKAEQDNRVEHLRAQLQLVNKLLEFAAWQHNVRSARNHLSPAPRHTHGCDRHRKRCRGL